MYTPTVRLTSSRVLLNCSRKDINPEESVRDDKISLKSRQTLRGMNTRLNDIEREITALKTRFKTASAKEQAEISRRIFELE